MIITIKQAIDQARVQLADASKRYWSDADLLDYANQGRSLIYKFAPKVYETTEAVTLVEGSRQTLPNDSSLMFRPIENVSALSQRAITAVDGELLARARPRWRSEAPADEIVHVLYRESEPKVYETYPPAAAGTVIRISYARPPEPLDAGDLSGDSVELTAEGELGEALIDYIISRGFGKQADTSPDAGQMSGDYLKLFLTKVGTDDAIKMAKGVNATTRGTRPANAVT